MLLLSVKSDYISRSHNCIPYVSCFNSNQPNFVFVCLSDAFRFRDEQLRLLQAYYVFFLWGTILTFELYLDEFDVSEFQENCKPYCVVCGLTERTVSCMWRCVIWQICNDVLETPTASIFGVDILNFCTVIDPK